MPLQLVSYQFAVKAILGFDGTSRGKDATLPLLAGASAPGAPSMAHDTRSHSSMTEGERVSELKDTDQRMFFSMLLSVFIGVHRWQKYSLFDGDDSQRKGRMATDKHR